MEVIGEQASGRGMKRPKQDNNLEEATVVAADHLYRISFRYEDTDYFFISFGYDIPKGYFIED